MSRCQPDPASGLPAQSSLFLWLPAGRPSQRGWLTGLPTTTRRSKILECARKAFRQATEENGFATAKIPWRASSLYPHKSSVRRVIFTSGLLRIFDHRLQRRSTAVKLRAHSLDL